MCIANEREKLKDEGDLSSQGYHGVLLKGKVSDATLLMFTPAAASNEGHVQVQVVGEEQGYLRIGRTDKGRRPS